LAAVKAMNVLSVSEEHLNPIFSPSLVYRICLTLRGSVTSQINGSLFGLCIVNPVILPDSTDFESIYCLSDPENEFDLRPCSVIQSSHP
jgi:glycerol uptake facilitator-like aquaporin